MKNKFLIICITFLFEIAVCVSGQNKQRPNIIYVLADDMGYGDVSVLNSKGKIKTAYLDQMANEGMIFTDAHTSSSVSTPTRYGILTGRYNWRTELKKGVLYGKSKALIPNERTTIASMLKESDYNTAFIGKWHLGWDWASKDGEENSEIKDFDQIDYTKSISHSPNDIGFDYAYGHVASLDMPPYVYVENGKATALPDTITVNTGKYSWWREGPTSPDFIHEDVTPNFFRRANKYITEKAKEDSPFFLYLALPSPHTPILPTKEWQGKSGLNPYGDFVMMIDNYMGELLKTIKEAGIEENTLLIFTSDNGCSPAAGIDELQKAGHYPSYIYRGHKADIFEGGHRVPFIVKWPTEIEKGSVCNQIICTTDLLATLADIVDYTLKDNEGEDSFSMLPLFDKNTADSAIRPDIIHHSINGNFAISKGDWKLIMCPGSGGWSYPRPNKNDDVIATLPPIQLYNLADDPGETKNLQAEKPEVVAELKSILTGYIKNGRSTPGLPQQNDTIDFEWEQIGFVKKQ